MKKVARPAYWDKVERGLRKITNLPGEVHNLINDRSRLNFHNSIPSGVNSNAKAYVSTEDANDDGTIDNVHIVVTNLEREWPQEILSKINTMNENDPVFQDIVKSIAHTLVHELAHISDYKDGDFPGGEAVAESKERSFNPIFSNSSTTYSNIVRGNNMKTDLVKLANHLDQIGHKDLADRLDLVLATIQDDTEIQQKLEEQYVPEEEADAAQAAHEANQKAGQPTFDEGAMNILAKKIEDQFSVFGGKINR
tara:strand:+ start:3290 stop:4045 length:756 start_codon:yes stop_codon:yes gene_type:complete